MLNHCSLRCKLLLALMPFIIVLGYFATHTLHVSFQQATISESHSEFYFKATLFSIITVLIISWVTWILRDVVRMFDNLSIITTNIIDGQWQESIKVGGNREEIKLLQSLSHIQTTWRDHHHLMSELKRVFSALSLGDLTQMVSEEYSGNSQVLKEDINSAITQLRQSIFDIKHVIDAAAQGIFNERVSLDNKQGFFKELGDNLNHNLILNQQVLEDVMRVFAAVSMGDLKQTMTRNYPGMLEQLKTDVNVSVRKLNEIMDEIGTAVEMAARGIFDKRVNLAGKEGFFKQVAENLNRNLEINQQMIEELMLVFSAMSQGDLRKYLVNEYVGRLAELKQDVNTTLKKLNEMMSNIAQVTDQIDSGTEEVVQGNAELSQRTEEQAAALEETASSMQQMTNTVRQTADNAQQANQLSLEAKLSAEQGGKIVYQTVQAMSEINKSSSQVSDIIGVIDEIAFQTNLLALNAAVEAARAGEQGRGFAVVATEVRNLAQRSAAAAKEIKQLIKSSSIKVAEGSQLVDQSGKALDQIVLNVKKVSDIIAEIAAAGLEQSSGISQVNQAVMQFDDTTQQNAAMVEEITANSTATREQVKTLHKLLSFFQFEGIQIATDTDVKTKRHAPALSPNSTAHVSKPGHSSKPVKYSKSANHQAKSATHLKTPIKEGTDDDNEWSEF